VEWIVGVAFKAPSPDPKDYELLCNDLRERGFEFGDDAVWRHKCGARLDDGACRNLLGMWGSSIREDVLETLAPYIPAPPSAIEKLGDIVRLAAVCG